MWTDGIDALDEDHRKQARHRRASEKIYNIGNPANNLSVRDLAKTMVELALTYPEYRDERRRK